MWRNSTTFGALNPVMRWPPMACRAGYSVIGAAGLHRRFPGGPTCASAIAFAMTQERHWNVISTVALIVVAAVWLWFLFAYADLIFRRPNANSYDRFGQSFHELMLKVSDLGSRLEAARIASIARSASEVLKISRDDDGDTRAEIFPASLRHAI
jgi:hypothetical protein